jgi:hypothetical protein
MGSFFLALLQIGAKTRVFEPGCGRENARKSKAPPRIPPRTSLDFHSSPRGVVKLFGCGLFVELFGVGEGLDFLLYIICHAYLHGLLPFGIAPNRGKNASF